MRLPSAHPFGLEVLDPFSRLQAGDDPPSAIRSAGITSEMGVRSPLRRWPKSRSAPAFHV
jgi:hypothetical protein